MDTLIILNLILLSIFLACNIFYLLKSALSPFFYKIYQAISNTSSVEEPEENDKQNIKSMTYSTEDVLFNTSAFSERIKNIKMHVDDDGTYSIEEILLDPDEFTGVEIVDESVEKRYDKV